MRKLKWTNFVAIAVGAAIMGLGLNAFNITNSLAEGGVTGVAILLKFLFDWDPGLLSLLLNIPLLVIGWRMLGRVALIYTAFGTVAVSGFLSLFAAARYPIDDSLIAALLAGTTMGAGLGLVFRFGGTTGGVDIIARIFRKHFGFRLGRTMFASDILVVIASLSYLDVKQAGYTLIAVFVGARVVDFVQEAGYSMRSAIIVSRESAAIAARIMSEMNRGATYFEGAGAYTGEAKKIVYVVIGRSEVVRLKNLVVDIDPDAFCSISDAGEVLGEGFTLDEDRQPLPS